MNEFVPFPKVPRLSRDMVVTEKIDGTNASVWIKPISEGGMAKRPPLEHWFTVAGRCFVSAGSRSRFLMPGKQTDNFGFAVWVFEHAQELAEGLGEGAHYGEWWGGKIQRGYGLPDKRFSLFNTGRWCDGLQTAVAPDTVSRPPACCHVVPALYRGPFDLETVDQCLHELGLRGSIAALGFKPPEGVMIFHEGARQMFKKTFDGDEAGKGS